MASILRVYLFTEYRYLRSELGFTEGLNNEAFSRRLQKLEDELG